MSFTNQTTHYGLPQWIGSDKPTYLVDQNNAYQTIDSEIYNANVTAGEAVTTANGAASTAGAASSTAADALSAAQTASSTADSALTAAQDAGTIAQAAQTAAGAAQTAAQAAQEAAAGNSITNLAPAYDPTITYVLDALVTEAGKFYKCIVAVDTPEQFDVNKWDDVTTSEVYARVGSGGDVYTKAEADAKFETQTHATSTFETISNVSAKNNLKLSTDASKQIRFGIDGNGNYGYIKNGENTVNPFRSGAALVAKYYSYSSKNGGVAVPVADIADFTHVKLTYRPTPVSTSVYGVHGTPGTGTSTEISGYHSGDNTINHSVVDQYDYIYFGYSYNSESQSSEVRVAVEFS